ncbi:hypothetical protein EMN47_14065 [Prolixibacteraceae bacterium JC049]|nr:hypothetical protein [Prolixibacteraceae bacterium JC049]
MSPKAFTSTGLLIFIGILFIIFLATSLNNISHSLHNSHLYGLYAILLPVSVLAGFQIIQKKKIRISIIDVLTTALLLIVSVNSEYNTIGNTLLFLLYVIVRTLGQNIHRLLLIGIIIGGVFEAIYGNLQLYNVFSSNHSSFSLTGHFFNPGPYAGFLIVSFAVAFTKYMKEIDAEKNALISVKWKQYLLILSLVLITLVLPATRSRAAWLASGAVVLYVLFYFSVRKFLPKRLKELYRIIGTKWALVVFTVLLSILLCGIYFFKKDSANGRLLIWKASIPMVLESPIIGHGTGSFKAKYMDYQASYFQDNMKSDEVMVADNTTYAFNEPLKLLIEQGLIGGLLAVGLLYFIFFKKGTDSNSYLLSARAGLLAFLIFGLFSYPSSILPIMVNSVLLLAIVSNYSKQKDLLIPLPIRILVVLSGMCLIIWTGVWLKRYYNGLRSWKDASDIYAIGEYDASIKNFKEAYPLLKKNGNFLINYGKALAMAKRPDEAIILLNDAKRFANNTVLYTALGDSYKMQSEFLKAEEAYQKAYAMIPSRFYPLYLLANLYKESGEVNKAVRVAQQIMRKPIKVESRAILEMKNEMEVLINNYK